MKRNIFETLGIIPLSKFRTLNLKSNFMTVMRYRLKYDINMTYLFVICISICQFTDFSLIIKNIIITVSIMLVMLILSYKKKLTIIAEESAKHFFRNNNVCYLNFSEHIQNELKEPRLVFKPIYIVFPVLYIICISIDYKLSGNVPIRYLIYVLITIFAPFIALTRINLTIKRYKNIYIEYYNQIYKESKVSLFDKIYLRTESIKGILSFLNFLCENLILFKFQFFKNYPRSNFIFIRSILMCCVLPIYSSVIVFIIFYFAYINSGTPLIESFLLFVAYIKICLLKNLDKVSIYLGATTSIIFWNMGRISFKKWNYCSTLQAKIKTEYNEKLEVILALNILKLDLWAHPILRTEFASTLKKAISYETSSVQKRVLIIRKYNEGKYHEDNAEEVLQNYYNNLS